MRATVSSGIVNVTEAREGIVWLQTAPSTVSSTSLLPGQGPSCSCGSTHVYIPVPTLHQSPLHQSVTLEQEGDQGKFRVRSRIQQ